MGDETQTAEDRRKDIVRRAGFHDRILDNLYVSGAGGDAVTVVTEVIDYLVANVGNHANQSELPFPVETQAEQPFEVLAKIVEKTGGADLDVGLDVGTTARTALQGTVRAIFRRLHQATRAHLDHLGEIAPRPEHDIPETGGQDSAPYVP